MPARESPRPGELPSAFRFVSLLGIRGASWYFLRTMSIKNRSLVDAVGPDPATAAERMELALALGERCLQVYMAAHPEVSRADATEILQKKNRHGRVSSAVADGPPS